MKRAQKSRRWVRLFGTLLCLPLLYFFAAATFPSMEPVLSKAAILSAQLSNPLQATGTEAFGGNLQSTNANTEAEETDITQPDASSPETTTSSSVSSSSDSHPSNTGIVLRKTYTEGKTSVYIKTGDGYVKNCTDIPAQKVQSVLSQTPTFKIKTNGKPMVLIMHTHTTESYQPSLSPYYDKSYHCRTTDKSKSVCLVGDAITKELQNAGIGVIHNTTYHDYPSYNGSYDRSAVTVKRILKENPSIKVVLDIHRDAIQPDENTMIAPVTTINQKSCAQVMIISGCDDGTMDMPNYMENLKFAGLLQRTIAKNYPTLARPVLFDYRKYNQNLTTGSLLLEVGGHANTLDEATYCGELVGKCLSKALLTLK